GVTMPRRPFGDVGVKALAVLHHGREEKQVAAALQLALQSPSKFIAGLGLDRELAIRTELRSQPREEEPDEMINLGHGGDRAFAAAAGIALLDAYGRRNAGDQVDVRPRKLFDELPRVDVHRIQKAPLSLREDEVEGQRAFSGTADAGDDDKAIARDG